MKSYDLTFVGGGPNNAVVLTQLLKRIEAQLNKGNELKKDEINILFIDKNGDFFKGLAWGNHKQSEHFSMSAPASEHFIRSNDTDEFVKYLFKFKGKYFPTEFPNAPIEDYNEKTNKKAFNEFKLWVNEQSLPRKYVGDFLESLKQEVEGKIESLQNRGVTINLEYKKAWAIDIDKVAKGYNLTLAEDTKTDKLKTRIDKSKNEIIKTEICCLGLGLPQDPVFNFRAEGYFPTIYGKRGVEDFKEYILKEAKNNPPAGGEKLQVAFLGSNAAFMDFARFYHKNPELHEVVDLTVISRYGALPVPYIKSDKCKDSVNEAGDFVHGNRYRCKFLTTTNKNIKSGEDLITEYEKEIKHAKKEGYSLYDVWLAVQKTKNAVVQKLSKDEREKYYRDLDNRFELMVTTTSPEGAKEVEQMIKKGIMRIDTGIVRNVDYPATTDEVIDVSLKGRPAQEYKCVVSGLGQSTLDITYFPLIRNLLSKGLAEITTNGRGLVVDNTLQTQPNIIVTGPLLSGNHLSEYNIELAIRNGDKTLADQRQYPKTKQTRTRLHNLSQNRWGNKIAVTTISNEFFGIKIDKDIFVPDPGDRIAEMKSGAVQI